MATKLEVVDENFDNRLKKFQRTYYLSTSKPTVSISRGYSKLLA